jgi:hypothetical protein
VVCFPLVFPPPTYKQSNLLPFVLHAQSKSPQPISKRSILILSTHLCLDFPSGPFPSRFPTSNLYAFLFARIIGYPNLEKKKKTRRLIPSPPSPKIRNASIGKGSNALQQQNCKCPGQRSAIPHVTLRSSARWQNHPLFVVTRTASALGRGIEWNLLLGRAAIFRLTSVATAHSIVSHLPPPPKSKFDRHSNPKCEQLPCPPGPLECPFRSKNNFHRNLAVGCCLVFPFFGNTLGPSTFLAHRTLFNLNFLSTGIFASWSHPVSPPRL